MFSREFADLGNGQERFLKAAFIVIAAIASFIFIGWQLRNRRIASHIVGACERLLAQLQSGGSRPELTEVRTYEGVLLPRYLFDEVVAVSESNRFRGASTTEVITYVTMAAMAVLVVLRISG
jgi:hypothetical protein